MKLSARSVFRLEKLAKFLDELPENRLDMRRWADEAFCESDCNTVACALGWSAVVFPRSIKIDSWDALSGPYYRYGDRLFYREDAGSAFFFGRKGLNMSEFLFLPASYPRNGYAVKPSQVAQRIRWIIKESENLSSHSPMDLFILYKESLNHETS